MGRKPWDKIHAVQVEFEEQENKEQNIKQALFIINWVENLHLPY
jgi:hypothetical protein